MADTPRDRAIIVGPAPDNREVDIVQYMIQCRNEATSSRRERMVKNAINRNAYHNRQDWSHKIEGQSREFLPKTSVTVEQFKAFVKRGLVQFGRYFSMTMPPGSPIDGNDITQWLHDQFKDLPDTDDKRISLALKISDAVGVALLEAYAPLKIHGGPDNRHIYRPTADGGVELSDLRPYQLRIDLIKPEDFYEDPTGRGLYKIHDVERDLWHLKDNTKTKDNPLGIYDAVAVNQISESFQRLDSEHVQRDAVAGQTVRIQTPRKPIRISEFWGSILDSQGSLAQKKVFYTVVNDQWVVRKPQPYPFWHGEDPFEKLILIRVPFTVVHKALYDQVVPLNLALNELFNLILDGGLAAVWGIRQARPDLLEDETQMANGVGQGATLILREGAPKDAKAIETVISGKVPPDALATYNLADREFNVAALTSDLKQGLLPPKQVKATEIVEVSANQAIVLDSIVADMESSMDSIVRKSYLTLLQFADDLEASFVAASMGRRDALLLARMTPAERFTFLGQAGVRVFGLSATLQRARDFQRLMALLQVVMANPMMMRSFMRNYSSDKILNHAFRLLNINPERFERDEQEKEQLPQELEDLAILFQLQGKGRSANTGGAASGSGPSGASGRGSTRGTLGGAGGEPGLQSEINQQVKPTGGEL